jgi:hypothetical protein
MADNTTKQIVITTTTIADSSKVQDDISIGGSVKKSGKTRRKKSQLEGGTTLTIKKLDGAGMSPGTVDQIASTRAPGHSSTDSTNTPARTMVPQGIQKIGGSSSEQRVILTTPANAKKVFLAPAPPKNEKVVSSKKGKTMKRVKVDGLKIRIKKAKTIKKKSLKTDIHDIKKELVSSGLVKEDSKAPESILRDMYTDVMVLKKRAL